MSWALSGITVRSISAALSGMGGGGGNTGSFPEQRLVIEPSITVSLVRPRPHYNPFENTYIPMCHS